MGIERTDEREFQPVQVRIGFACSEPKCDWKLVSTQPNQKPPELYEALPLFGKHNLEKHGGSIEVHMVPVTKTKKLFTSR